jgi:hypothetical protein
VSPNASRSRIVQFPSAQIAAYPKAREQGLKRYGKTTGKTDAPAFTGTILANSASEMLTPVRRLVQAIAVATIVSTPIAMVTGLQRMPHAKQKPETQIANMCLLILESER